MLMVSVRCGGLEDRLDSRGRRFLRMLVLFVVVIVDHEELVYILVESCDMFVVHSFAFLLCLSRIRSLIWWRLSTVSIQSEYPMFCILNSFRFAATYEWYSKKKSCRVP